MNLSMRLRKFGNRIRFPLVTRARFELNQANYEAELKQIESERGGLGDLCRNLKQEVAELKRKLEVAEKNDHRDPATGRFDKAH